MKAAVLEAVGTVRIRDVEVPAVGPEDVLIRVAYAGVCGSDLHAFRGVHPFRRPPVILGHEVAGIVERVGGAVSGFSPGDRVTVMPYLACGCCLTCRADRPNICPEKRAPGPM